MKSVSIKITESEDLPVRKERINRTHQMGRTATAGRDGAREELGLLNVHARIVVIVHLSHARFHLSYSLLLFLFILSFIYVYFQVIFLLK